MHSRSRAVTFLAAFFFAISTLISAQTATSSLRGTITDPKGAILQGATVVLANSATGYSRTTKSGNDGVYQFLEIPPATYTLTVTALGFATVKQDKVSLQVSQPATLDIAMEVRGTSEVVEVSGQAPLVNTQDASLGHAFNTEQVLSLPFEGRDPTAILSLQPGVTYTGNNQSLDPSIDSRSGSVAGGRSDQANITIDGVDNNDPILGNSFVGVLRATLDSLQEFRVTTAGGTADEGRASGAQVVLVTKSGTNQFHGSLFDYERPTFTTANDWFIKNSQALAGEPNLPVRVLRHTFGASLGGPIMRDRFFFFASYEGQRNREDTVVTRIVPSDNLRNGIVSYVCDATDPNCPASGVEQLSAATLAQLDPNCSTTPGFGPGGTCPLGPGPNPAVEAILQQYPHPNTDIVGDGFNFRGFNFSAPAPGKLNTYILKLDYNLTPNGNHRLFVRGNLQNDSIAGTVATGPQFPGAPPDNTEFSNNKGIAVGYTALFHGNLINNLRYGYIRQGLDNVGLQTQHFVNFRGMDDLTGETSTVRSVVPVHNIVDDVTWTKGKHTIQFGANLRIINDGRIGNADSFNFGQTNVSWLDNAGIANTGSSLDPCASQFASLNLPCVSSSFGQSYDLPVAAITGIVPFVQGEYNQDKTGRLLTEGAAVPRNFRAHEGEWYVQDAWRVKPSLTLTLGLRYTLLQPPYETHGNQIAPDQSLNHFFKLREQAMRAGQTYDPLIGLNISGQANGKAPYWAWDYKDFAPRFAIAWSPAVEHGWLRQLSGGPGKLSVRAGYGLYYDHFGEGIVNTFDRNGAFGLTTLVDNPAGTQDVDTSPRFTTPDVHTIPVLSGGGCNTPPCNILPAAPSGTFPAIPPTADQNGGFSITWGLDDKLKTPYSHVVNLSITRELPRGFVLETSYVGRFAHRLLQEEDLAMPLDIVDPASHVDYFSAAQTLGRAAMAGTSIQNIGSIPYWEDLFSGAAGPTSSVGSGCAPGSLDANGNFVLSSYTATQAMYDSYACNVGNETTALFLADFPGICFPACSQLPGQTSSQPLNFFDSQWSSLYAWRSIGNSVYNGLQVSLRKRMTTGLNFDVNYTYSKSIDVGSNAERINEFEGFGFASQIINAWSPKQLRAVSDFDNTHQINANWVYDLPIGRGKRFGGSMGSAMDAILGGWQIAGLWRWSSGFPFSIGPGLGFWSTDWQLTSSAVLTGPKPKTGAFVVPPTAGQTPEPDVFQNPSLASQSFRVALAGESGDRNNLRGPGTLDIDASLAKSWRFGEGKALTFRWETFNVTNTPRFDVGQMQFQGNNSLATAGTFGVFLNTLNKPRLMEFALRFQF